MSRFVEDDWLVGAALAPVPRNWPGWVAQQGLVDASEAELRLRWAAWLRTHEPSADLARSMRRGGRQDLLETPVETETVRAAESPAEPGAIATRSGANVLTPFRAAVTMSWSTSAAVFDGPVRGEASVYVADRRIWHSGQVDGLEILSWLSDHWTHLRIEDQFPFLPRPQGAAELRARAARGQRGVHAAGIARYLVSHDLGAGAGAGMGGQNSLVVWREGLYGCLLNEQGCFVVEWAALERALDALGESILDNVAVAADLQGTLARWEERAEVSAVQSLEIAAGHPGARFPRVVQALDRELEAVPLEFNELLAVARMSSPLPAPEISEILNEALSLGRGSFIDVDEIGAALLPVVVQYQGMRAWRQGHALAAVFRALVGADDGDRFDPARWLANVHVDVRYRRFATAGVDAISCWGPQRGPAVIVNLRGLHAKAVGGRNVTLAHEIAHLVLDRKGALPVAEVLGGRTQQPIEARAKAFAAELLLSRRSAGAAFKDVASVDQARSVLRSVSTNFGVSAEVTAWQVRNSGQRISAEVRAYLKTLVGEPGSF